MSGFTKCTQQHYYLFQNNLSVEQHNSTASVYRDYDDKWNNIRRQILLWMPSNHLKCVGIYTNSIILFYVNMPTRYLLLVWYIYEQYYFYRPIILTA